MYNQLLFTVWPTRKNCNVMIVNTIIVIEITKKNNQKATNSSMTLIIFFFVFKIKSSIFSVTLFRCKQIKSLLSLISKEIVWHSANWSLLYNLLVKFVLHNIVSHCGLKLRIFVLLRLYVSIMQHYYYCGFPLHAVFPLKVFVAKYFDNNMV